MSRAKTIDWIQACLLDYWDELKESNPHIVEESETQYMEACVLLDELYVAALKQEKDGL